MTASVLIDGRDPRVDRTQVLGRVGFVPQLPPPLKMPVGQLIDFAAALCGTPPRVCTNWPRGWGWTWRPSVAPVQPPVGRHEAEAADRHCAGPRRARCW
jgi:hypothetical protein